ncbi:MAG: RNA 2',3'-cyclic phosphodiesterase [Kofleriaceae bacterium]
MRLFFGLRVSTATANQLAQTAEQLRRNAGPAFKWVAPTSYHVTLKYLGFTRPEIVDELVDRVRTAIAGIEKFSFKTAKLGAFPSVDKATVLWAGVDDANVTALADKIEGACEGVGFPREPRPFKGHVTLARIAETRSISQLVLPMSEQMFSGSTVDTVILYESETKSSGSVYKEISRIALKTSDSAPISPEKRQTEPLDLGDETDDGWPRGR